MNDGKKQPGSQEINGCLSSYGYFVHRCLGSSPLSCHFALISYLVFFVVGGGGFVFVFYLYDFFLLTSYYHLSENLVPV
jgi:hypothetical protein